MLLCSSVICEESRDYGCGQDSVRQRKTKDDRPAKLHMVLLVSFGFDLARLEW